MIKINLYFRIITVVSLLSLFILLLIFLSKGEKARYEIRQGNNLYFTNLYSIDSNGCLSFTNTKKINVLICDKYTIIDKFGK